MWWSAELSRFLCQIYRTCEEFVSNIQNHPHICKTRESFVWNIRNLLLRYKAAEDFVSNTRNSRGFCIKYVEVSRVSHLISEAFHYSAWNIPNFLVYCIKYTKLPTISYQIYETICYLQNRFRFSAIQRELSCGSGTKVRSLLRSTEPKNAMWKTYRTIFVVPNLK